MRILYQFPLSHYCEKARWMLDHKELDYVAQNLVPGVHRLFVQFRTGQHRLPMLYDTKEWIADSTDIAEYLDKRYPEHSLYRRDEDQRKQIEKIDAISQELGVHVRRWLFSFILNQKEKTAELDIILGEKGVLKDLEKVSVPVLKFALKRTHQISAQTVIESKQKIDETLQDLNQILTQNGGRYLVGDRLTLADIAVCSMIAPLLMIDGTPWEIHEREIDDEILQLQHTLLDLPLGQYVKRIYETERNARVDWRGV